MKKAGEKMKSTLDMTDYALNIGDVKTITYNGGRNIRLAELLFSPTTRIQMAPTDDKRMLRIRISDNNLQIPELDCLISRKTLRDYFIALKYLYDEMTDDEEI